MELDNFVKFGPWTLELDKYLLFTAEVEYELDPLCFKLLCHFLSFGNKITTREELSKAVWKQNYVDDNAIYRAISELRKCLKHPAYQSQFIKTHHKKGYSFTAPVSTFAKRKDIIEKTFSSQIEKEPINVQENTKEQSIDNVLLEKKHAINKKPKLLASFVKKIAAFSLFLGFISAIFAIVQTNEKENVSSMPAKSITWEPGAEYNPLLSNDGNFFAYRNTLEGKDTSYIQRKSDKHKIKLDYQGNNIDVLSWHANGDQILTAIYDDNVCNFALFDISSFPEVASPKSLIPCGRLLNNSAQLSHDKQYLYYVKQIQGLTKTSVYRYDLQNKSEIELISKDELHGGVLHFELSALENKMSILTADFKSPMHVGLFDLDTHTYQTILKLKHSYYGFMIDWAVDNNELVVIDKNTLYKIDIDTLTIDESTLPENIYPYNLEIESANSILYTPYTERTSDLIRFNDLFNDYKPELEPVFPSDMLSYNPAFSSSSKVFFASDRTGTHEVWQGKDGKPEMITNFNDICESIGPIRESPNGEYVLFRRNKRLKLIRLADKQLIDMNDLPSDVSRYYWSGNTIVYSIENQVKDQIWQYDSLLRSQRLLVEEGGRGLLVNEKGEIFYTKNKQLINLENGKSLALPIPSYDPTFSVLTEKHLYVHDSVQFIYRVNLENGYVEKDKLMNSPGEMSVDLNSGSIMVTKFSLADTSIKRLVL